MRIRFLGTSGHGPTLTRNLPATLIDECILLDCGEGTLLTLKRLQIPLSDIRYILLSHLHADHMLGIVSLLWDLAFYSSIRKCPFIYVPEGMKAPFLQLFQDTFSPYKNVGFEMNVEELPIDRKKIELNCSDVHYNIEYTPTQHTPLCYAYKINHQVVFSGDTQPFDQFDLFLKNLSHPSYLIHEASFPDSLATNAHRANHSTPMDATLIAKRNYVDYLYLYHLPDLTIEMEKEFIIACKELHPSVRILHDNDVIEF
jgi:ribonuclease BN (tRNA processing enzyme)